MPLFIWGDNITNQSNKKDDSDSLENVIDVASSKKLHHIDSQKNQPRTGNIIRLDKTGKELVISKDQHPNVLRFRNNDVKNLLNDLQRTIGDLISNQNVLFPRSNEPIADSGILENRLFSGKNSSKDFSIESSIQLKNRSRKKTDFELSQIKQLISQVEDFINGARLIGVDVTSLHPLLQKITTALNQGELSKAKHHIYRARSKTKKMIADKLGNLIDDIAKKTHRLEMAGGDASIPRDILDRARNSLAQERLTEACNLSYWAGKKLHDISIEPVLKVISEAKQDFSLAKKLGLEIDTGVAMLYISRELLRQGEIENAVRYAKDSKKIIDDSLSSYRKSIDTLLSCTKTLRLARNLGADISDLKELLLKSKDLFHEKEFERSLEYSKRLLEKTKKACHQKVSESIVNAEKAIELANDYDIVESDAVLHLENARKSLEKGGFLNSFVESQLSISISNTVLADLLNNKLKGMKNFADEISGEVEDLTKAQEAILHSKDRCIETMRKYTQLSEEVVNQAYDSAAAYTRVSQDILKQAFDNSIKNFGVNDQTQMFLNKATSQNERSLSEIIPLSNVSYEDRRLKIIELYLMDRITKPELDKFLSEIETSVSRAELI